MASAKLYLARTEVHITEKPGKAGDKAKGVAPVPPVVKIIPAGGKLTIDPDSDAAKELVAAGAIIPHKEENAQSVTKIGTPKAAARKAPAKKAAAKKDDDAAGGEGDADKSDDDSGGDMV